MADMLSIFLAGNVEKRENKKVYLERFKDKDGNIVPWEVRSITASEDEAIRKECTRKVPVVGKKNQYTMDFDSNAYVSKIVARAVVFPELSNAELQDSYGVINAEQLVKAMLYSDEFSALADAIMDMDESEELNELVDEAKN